jgi:hypothetical protein
MTTKLTAGQALCVPTVLWVVLALDGWSVEGAAQGSSALVPGAALKAGSTLTYGSGGREQPPWTIDSVHRDLSLGGRNGCTRIFLRMRPDQTSAPPRVACRGEVPDSSNAGGWRDSQRFELVRISIP